MSLIGSLLAFVLIPLKAKPQPKEADNLAVMALADEVRRLTVALDYWRNSGNALWDENERLRAELQDARAQCDPTSPYYQRLQQPSYLQARQASQAQMNAQMAQQALDQGLYQRQALGQQNAFAHCNCVPSRAQAFDNENTRRQEG